MEFSQNYIIKIKESDLNELITKAVKEAICRNDRVNSSDFDWVSNIEAAQLLGVSTRQLKNYRDKKLIPFSKFGRKIYFRRSDLNEFLIKNYKQNND